MTEIAERIVERLPGFYRAREKRSFIHILVEGISKVISEQERDIALVRDSHWIKTASGRNLDHLALIFGLERKAMELDEDYRSRIMISIATMRKGGTVEAVKTQLAAYLGAQKEEIILVENPAREITVEKKVKSRDTWKMSSASICDESATVIISVKDGEAKDPTIVNLDSKLLIRFNGTLKKGEILEIRREGAKLDGIDVTSSITWERDGKRTTDRGQDFLVITTRPCNWVFREKLTDTIAVFDRESKFDEHIFHKPVAPIELSFKWTARLLAAFEIKIASQLLQKSSLTVTQLLALVNAIKAAGVRAFVTIMPQSDESVITPMTSHSTSSRRRARSAPEES